MNVIVTGAAQGLGEGVAEHLSQRGHHLMLADIQEEKVEAVATRLGAVSLRVDISEPTSARELALRSIAELGTVDALVNVAGINAPQGSAVTTSEALWKRVIETDLSGPWWCISALLPHLLEEGGGRVVVISSGAAWSAGPDITPAYNAAKAGLHGLVVALATQLERSGVRVNAIAPGATGTGHNWSHAERVKHEHETPLGFGGSEPVARMVSHLLGPGGDWISGAIFNVSGGITKGR